MGAAACHDDGRDWTSPTVPRPSVVTNLALTCQFCPVAVDCGLYALHTDAEMGMYAGVWLPAHGYRTAKPRARWLAARAAITRRISHVS